MDNRLPSHSVLPSDIRAALRARREMFAATPSVVPHLHRRIRAAAMERASLRQTLETRLGEWTEALFGHGLRPARLGYVGAVAAVALALTVGLQHSWNGGETGQPLLTLNTPSDSNLERVNYAMNDAGSLPVSLDQKIDGVLADASDLKNDVVSAHYVLTSAPATYDSVVAF